MRRYESIANRVVELWMDSTTVVSGTAKGADKLGENWAELNNIPLEKYPADWNKFGKSAGYKRNTEMANNAEALIALWDGKSRGTKHMIDIATTKKLQIYIHFTEEQENDTRNPLWS